MVSVLDFQSKDDGSIPFTCSNKKSVKELWCDTILKTDYTSPFACLVYRKTARYRFLKIFDKEGNLQIMSFNVT